MYLEQATKLEKFQKRKFMFTTKVVCATKKLADAAYKAVFKKSRSKAYAIDEDGKLYFSFVQWCGFDDTYTMYVNNESDIKLLETMVF